MLINKKNQHGLTLIELMISLAIGQLLTGAMIILYVTSVKGNVDNLRMSTLNQDMNAMLRLISSDVRRAGFWAAVPGTDDLTVNPFMSDANDLLVSEKTGEATNSCVIYSYDLDKDKLVDVGVTATSAPYDAAPYDTGNVEQFGFRINGTSMQMRTGLASASESSFTCNNGAWTTITDSKTEITALAFSETIQYLNVTNGMACSPATTNCCTTGQACQLIRGVNINITGRLTTDTSVVKTVSSLARIRNDKYVVVL